jgi:hypothetical protein
LTGLGSNVEINKSGTVVFTSFFPGGIGVFTQSTLVAKAGDTIGGKTLNDVSGFPAINNRGTVAFYANFPGGGGIFTQSAMVAKLGDAIGGQTLTGIGLLTQINESGTIAFLASDTGGSQMIITALPFAGTPGQANCHGKSVSALSQQYGGMDSAAAALGFPSVQALQNAIKTFCK